ncbi:L,D-transpeptidase [[Pseudomonas] carboxydohydrogena]|uniref:L,D-transpeptidase n=1 Tax=Afipia carboxydohydrogena TaxID=290 RepID=A0ABY8BV03_AFICR|nr:L,D-transpeptidase [[Pseudomonas] carboxydohydrogena]WEF52142.1 L,D-transpeptidase [[Pseudomonas] carboxydohydrogena]
MSKLARGGRDFFALRSVLSRGAGVSVMAAAMIVAAPASAQSLSYAAQPGLYWPQNAAAPSGVPDDDVSEDAALPDRLRRAVVSYPSREAPGTIVIDTRNTYLYLILGGNRAMRYGVGVGREGFTWSGVQTISRKAEWPDWHPPAQMIARQPYLPRFVAGGPGNPLGARAMYLGHSDYRIHGTNDPSTIGKFVSSGCIRLTNTDVEDLFSRVKVGAKVIVLPKSRSPQFEAKRAMPSQASLTRTTQTAGQPMQLSRLD